MLFRSPLPHTTRGRPIHIGYSHVDRFGTHIVYPTGSSIVIRNLANPLDTDIYYEHTNETTCAKYSPSGYYICSGDSQGNVRIWDTTQKEHPLKLELKVLSGPVYDIAWTGDSQRICVVGEGREKLGYVFMWDAGSSVGEISGQTKTLLSCDFKQQRPFRLITTGEDNYPCWFEGPPFKFKKSMKDIHTRFINCAKFSPDGTLCVCVSSDKMVSVYDGKTGELKYKKTEHKAGVYGVAFSDDSKTFMTASADKTCKLWNAEDGTVLKTIEIGKEVNDQQLGILATKYGPISVSLSGRMNLLDFETGEVKEIMEGHTNPVTAIANAGEYLYSASNDGHIVRWEKATGKAVGFSGNGHSIRINDIIICDDRIATLSTDDTVKFADAATLTYTDSVATESPANQGVYNAGVLYVATNKGIKVIKGTEVIQTVSLPNGVASIAITADKKTIAAGCRVDSVIKMYTIEADGQLTFKSDLTEEVQGTVYCMEFSTDGKYFIHSDDSRTILLRNAETFEVLYQRWIPHTSKVSKVAFNAENTLIATAGQDSNTYILNVETKAITSLGRTHKLGVNDVFIDTDGKVFTCGADSSIKVSVL